jgi:hypothetical protein
MSEAMNQTISKPAIILSQSLRGKIGEQIALTQSLMTRLPAGELEWRPLPDAFRAGDLLGHLLETVSGFCAAFYALYPDQLSHFKKLRDRQVNHLCDVAEAIERLSEYQQHIEEGFALLNDEDLARNLRTLFAAEGETAMTILLGNLEHLINHKYQLYFYLKLLGVAVGTPELYQFRGAQDSR